MRYCKPLSKNNPNYISEHRMFELRHFCMQYPEWKQGLTDISWIHKGDMPVSGGDVSDPVAELAERRERYLKNIELVENCCKETDEFLWKWLLIGVTTDVGYENLRLVHDIACCRNVYYRMYRRFFYILSKFR